MLFIIDWFKALVLTGAFLFPVPAALRLFRPVPACLRLFRKPLKNQFVIFEPV